ncbi:hypothetical protein GCM10023200_59770 [Actinomycetospora chlora]|uniref:Chaplin domain-containing protein n=1 Tax=Actinomycetospora chlora TaxID=663608 RepID=A0ABP9CM66_9PSEU
MTLRRLAAGTLAGSALLGFSLATADAASASESHGGHPASTECSTTGTATGSPGVQSGNVVQFLDCSEVASPTINGPLVGAPEV